MCDPPLDLDRMLNVAHEVIYAARRVLDRNDGRRARLKADGSEVTNADLEVERVARNIFAVQTPELGVIGEELPALETGSRYRWVVDPIDGTISFARGIPGSATLVALVDQGWNALVAVVDIPSLNWCFAAARGKGSTENGCPIRVRSGFDPSVDVVCRADRYVFGLGGRSSWFDALEAGVSLCRSYTDAFGHCLVARGSAALVVDPAMELWDRAATLLILREAGATVWESPATGSGMTAVVAGSGAAVAWAKTTLL